MSFFDFEGGPVRSDGYDYDGDYQAFYTDFFCDRCGQSRVACSGKVEDCPALSPEPVDPDYPVPDYCWFCHNEANQCQCGCACSLSPCRCNDDYDGDYDGVTGTECNPGSEPNEGWCWHCKVKITTPTPNECCPLCYNPLDGYHCSECGSWTRGIDYCYPCQERADLEWERAESIAESRAESRADQELAEELTLGDEMIQGLIEVTGSRRFS